MQNISLSILLSLGLVACNSGGSGGSSNQPADSTFSYKQGEQVAFFVGEISLGQASAAAEVTLFDMMGIPDPESITWGVQTKLKSTVQHSLRSSKNFQFERMSNLIIFLTAVDEDGVFSNGVVIPEQLETVAQDETIDIMGSQIFAFERDLESSNLLSEGMAKGLWSRRPSVVLPGVALDAFYNSVGVTPEIYTESKQLIDTDNDGIYDGNDDGAINYTFDGAGNVTSQHRLIIGDETHDQFTRHRYDDNGNLTGTYIDYGNDGTINFQQEWGYDSEGRETLNQTDNDGDGIFEYRTIKETRYHDNGSLAYQKETYESYSNDSGDLQQSYLQTVQYDNQGNRTYWERFDQDLANNESNGSIERSAFDLAGNLIKVEQDNNLDGVIDVIKRYEFDEQNRPTVEEFDFNADGTPDNVTSYTFDPEINQVTISYDNFANGLPEQADGVVDSVRVIDYDSYGNQIRRRLDENNDGTYEQETNWDISYDSEGRILSHNQLSVSSPEENRLITYSYDSEGRILTHQQVVDSDQAQNFLYTTTYNDEGRQTSYSAVSDDYSV